MATQLTQVTDDIYCAEHDIWLMGLVHFSARMTVVRLADGSVLIHSPIPLEQLAGDIEKLGPVRHILAPSGLHHLFLKAAAERFPDAAVYGPPAVLSKLKGFKPGVIVEDRVPEALSADFELMRIDGCPKVDELVLLHKRTSTLIVTDLVFNIHEAQGWFSPKVFRFVGAWQKVAQSKLWRSMTKDRAAAGASVRSLLTWDFDRLIMAHGQIVETGGRAALQGGLWWMLGEEPPPA